MAHNESEELWNKIKEIEARVIRIEQKLDSGKNISSTQPSDHNDGVKELAEKSKIPVEKIREMFDIESSQLTLLNIPGKNEIEKTKNGTLMVLLGYKYLFKRMDVLAQEVKRNLAENKVTLNNFATYLKDIIPSLIRRKGERGSNKATYRLTVVGEVEARTLLKGD